MIADRLRAAILQAAISGKLTDQRPEDGTAAELLEQITAERDELVKAKKLKKQKPLPPVDTASVPFELPSTWKWVRLGEIGSWAAGSTPSRSKPELYGGDIPWVKSGEVKQGRIAATEEAITGKALISCSVRLNPPGSVLVAMYGANIGDTGVLEVAATTNQAVCAGIPFSGVDSGFLSYFMDFSKQYLKKQGAGGAQPNISRTKIVDVPFPLPPLAEQERIVAKLDEVLPLIDQLAELEREREHLDREFATAIVRAILQAAISGKLTKQLPEDGSATELLETIQAERQRLEKEGKIKKQKSLPPVGKEDEPFELPSTWKWVRLGEIGSWAAGSTPSRSKPELYDGNIPWVKSGEVKQGRIAATEETITGKALISCSVRLNPPGSVLVAMYGANIGDTGVLEVAATTNQAVCACIPFSGVDSGFLSYFMGFSKQYLKKQVAGGAQPNISRTKIVDVPSPLAPRANQSRVATVLDQTMPLMRALGELVS